MATSLAEHSNLYVRVLQPDAKTAAAWRSTVSHSKQREQIGVVDQGFAADVFETSLFNLVVAHDRKQATPLTELVRILAPSGVLAFKNGDKALTDALGKLGLEALAGPNGWSLHRKPTRGRAYDWPNPRGQTVASNAEYQPCESLRWRAGPYWHIAEQYYSMAFAAGKFFYRERMEMPGDDESSRFELIARDAFNGRIVWRIQEEPISAEEFKTARSNTGLAASNDGKVFTVRRDRLVCLDAHTGDELFELMQSATSLRKIVVYKDKYVVAAGQGVTVFDATTGKELWKANGASQIPIHDDIVFLTTFNAILAYNIANGQQLWQVSTRETLPRAQMVDMFCSDQALHVVTIFPSSITALNPRTGTTLWTYQPQANSQVTYLNLGDKIYATRQERDREANRDLQLTLLDATTGKVEREDFGTTGVCWAGGCWTPRAAGRYILYHHNIWLNVDTLERSYPALMRPACAMGQLPANGFLYGLPSRKGGYISGVTSVGPADFTFDHQPGGKVLHAYGSAPQNNDDLRADDWPMFRANPARGNFVEADPGNKLTLAWQADIGLGRQTYGTMSGQRTGLTQPVSAYKLVVVADMEGQRIVALDVNNGNVKWSHHVGSRVDFSPTLYSGLCIFGAKDGWVYCLNAKTGEPIWKLLAAPRERYVGGHETIESLWPTAGDVLVVDGVGYVSAGHGFSVHGGVHTLAFKPETGEVIWNKCYYRELPHHERELHADMFVYAPEKKLLTMSGLPVDRKTGEISLNVRQVEGVLQGGPMDAYLGSNNLTRNCEDRIGDVLSDQRIRGRMIAFSDDLSIAFFVGRERVQWGFKGELHLAAAKNGEVAWNSTTDGMNIDDIVLTPNHIYCAGHYEREKKSSELRVVAAADGRILQALPIDGFPVFGGASAARDKVFVATREGKLVCFRSTSSPALLGR
jgi:outer membrane protein assembly factor BamB